MLKFKNLDGNRFLGKSLTHRSQFPVSDWGNLLRTLICLGHFSILGGSIFITSISHLKVFYERGQALKEALAKMEFPFIFTDIVVICR